MIREFSAIAPVISSRNLPDCSSVSRFLELRERVMSWRTYPVSTKDWRPTAFFMASMNSGACSGGRPATAFS